MKNKNIFWGVGLIIAAGILLLNQLGDFVNIGVWTVILTILLGSAIIDSAVRRNFIGLFLASALLYIVYQNAFDFYFIPPFTLLLSALLAGSGLSILFRRKPQYQKIEGEHWDADTSQQGEWLGTAQDNCPVVTSVFGSSTRYLYANSLESLQATAIFSSINLYFDNVHIAPQGAQVYVDATFSSVDLYVPSGWSVVDTIVPVMGGVNFKGASYPVQNGPVITLTGNVIFSTVNIIYIQNPYVG